jgi:hypothetical protein
MRAFVSLALVALGLAFVFLGYAALQERAKASMAANAAAVDDLIALAEKR